MANTPDQVTPGTSILVDPHVHYYPQFRRSRFLDSAWDNFRRESRQLGLDPAQPACIVLTESRNMDYFARWAQEVGQSASEAWALAATGDDRALLAQRGDGESIMILAGRQIITRERLEVLGLGLTTAFEDRHTLPETVGAVLEADAIPVIPWGFGKWTLKRRRDLIRFLESSQASRVFLGDSGVRPSLLPPSPLLESAAAKTLGVIPGSDPLPCAGEWRRVGSCGVVLSGQLDLTSPTDSLLKGLRDSRVHKTPYRQAETLPAFLWKQAWMQLKKTF